MLCSLVLRCRSCCARSGRGGRGADARGSRLGRAASAGIWFLPIYLGPTLALLLAGFNHLLDLEKIAGGSAESFIKNAAR